MMRRLLIPLLALAMLAACDERGDTQPIVQPLPVETPDSFLQYVNTQASLGAGDYRIVVATATPSERGDYTLTVTFDDGSEAVAQGRWKNSGGPDPAAAGNLQHSLRLERAGGIRIALHSTVDAQLYLVRNGHVLAGDDNSGPGHDALIDLPVSRITSEAYAEAYYRAMDPQNNRRTLVEWKRANGFDQGHDVHVVFRDSKDLGYGRNMYARRNDDGSIAVFVENYVIKAVPGASTNYGPVNVEAAVREDRRYHLGTNAIEFSPVDPDDPASEKIAKFFTFAPDGRQQRLTSADLDGRGVKHMPQMCWVCHGGRTMPLDENGDFPVFSQRSAKLNLLEVDSFDYSDLAGYSRREQEAEFRRLNRMVYDSYVEMGTRPADEAGRWHADFAAEIAAGRYGGPDFSRKTYNERFVPEGWRQTAFRPEGVETLYLRVVEPHCIACHSLQGTSAGENVTVGYAGQTVSLANAINFSSYEKFISYNDRIIDYVFVRGRMPASLRNYQKFWSNPDGAPAILASFLDGFDLYDAQGRVREAGRAVALAGADRTVTAPVQLDGGASLFADSHAWEILRAPPGANARLRHADTPLATLLTDTDGEYVLALTVRNATGSDTDRVRITVDSALGVPQRQLTFVDDIRPILGSDTVAGNCVQCHSADTTYDGIPASWRDDSPTLYRDVLARVNLRDPESSLLLLKPTQIQHGGNIQIDRDDPAGAEKYNTLVNWIRAGAVCGDDPMCP